MRRRLRLRGRLTVLTAGIVGLVLVLGSLAAYAAVRGALRDQIDDQLRQQVAIVRTAFAAGALPGAPGGTGRQPPRLPVPRTRAGGPIAVAQFVARDGRVHRVVGDVTLPVTAADRRTAADGGSGPGHLADHVVDGTHLRVITAPVSSGAIQIARPLTGVDGALHDLRIVLAVLVVAGTAAAALLARLFSAPVLDPVTDLTEAAEHIEATGDLGRRIEPRTDDEVGRMAVAFNGMLDRVQESVDAQRRLAADASHELRTPIAALRTNVEVLSASWDRLEPAQRQALMDDVVAQSDELGDLVADVIELARGEETAPEREDVRLDLLVAEAVDRARRRAPGVGFQVVLVPCVVPIDAARVARAVNNLLDNAVKYGGADGTVEVAVACDGARARIAVADAGPGVDPAEAQHIFERFARGAGAREQAGAGLGLAIVRQVAEAHGGRVDLEPAGGRGARFTLSLPGAAPVRT